MCGTRRSPAVPFGDLVSSQVMDPGLICYARVDAAAEFRPKLFGNNMSIHAVADNLGADEDDQFGTGHLFVLMRERVAEAWNLIEQGDSVALFVLLFADQSSQQDGLTGGH